MNLVKLDCFGKRPNFLTGLIRGFQQSSPEFQRGNQEWWDQYHPTHFKGTVHLKFPLVWRHVGVGGHLSCTAASNMIEPDSVSFSR